MTIEEQFRRHLRKSRGPADLMKVALRVQIQHKMRETGRRFFWNARTGRYITVFELPVR